MDVSLMNYLYNGSFHKEKENKKRTKNLFDGQILNKTCGINFERNFGWAINCWKNYDLVSFFQLWGHKIKISKYDNPT